MSMPSPTGDRQFRNQVVRVSELTVNSLILEGLTFQNCRIIGPAVLVPQGTTSFLHCVWDAPDMEAVFWEIPPARALVVGAVAAVDCTFSSCTLSEIGLGGSQELRRLLEQGTTR
jgi:hypothetical protein